MLALKGLLLKIRNKELDQFEILTEGTKLGVNLDAASNESEEIDLLEYAVLKELLKSDEIEDKDVLQTRFNSLSKTLNFGHLLQKYLCTYVGCPFKGKRHKDYLNHMKTIHPKCDRLKCSYKKKCELSFSTYEHLKKHVDQDHAYIKPVQNNTRPPEFMEACKCKMIQCGEMKFSSIRELTGHLNTFHKPHHRECIFENCKTKFKPGSVSRNHFQTNHYRTQETRLKPEFRENLEPYISPQEPFEVENEVQFEEDFSTLTDNENSDDSSSSSECEIENEVENQFMMSYADFLNRLINFRFIPISTVHEIASELLDLTNRASSVKKKKLKSSLLKIPNVSEEQVSKVIEEFADDPLVRAQSKLDTEYKRVKFLEENFKYVKPQEIVLNKEEVKKGAPKEVVQYIDILEAVKILAEDYSFSTVTNRECEISEESQDIIRDVKDASAYKNNEYWKENPTALVLGLYSDAVELVSPIGSGKGKQKIVQLFWTVYDVPKHLRSTVDRIQLGMVFKEKLLKKYSQATIFNRLIEDLKTLETVGVEIFYPYRRNLKAAVLLYSADNLEAGQLFF